MGYFYHTFQKEALNKAYELMQEVTPLPYDCGFLCGNKCCKGEKTDGMLLFPGEEVLFDNRDDYRVLFNARYNEKTVVCQKPCNRNERPLSCRIYPYMFYTVQKEGTTKISVAPDVRALNECPICQKGYGVSRAFLRNLRLAAKSFEQDEEIVKYLERLTAALTDFGGLDR